MKKPLIIFDTDMDTDCDDVGALAILYEYVKRDRAELLGIITDAPCDYAAPFCEVMGNYYGINRPIGAAVNSGENPKYIEHSKKHSRYNKRLSEELGKTDKDYPSDVYMYRKLLADVPDKSVTVVCVGLLTSAKNALMSEPDSISPLTGRELFEKKVQKVISMSEVHNKEANFNWDMAPAETEIFLKECPVPLYVSAHGIDIITGKSLSRLEDGHPVKEAYRLFGVEKTGRSSWDLIAVLYALEGDGEVLCKKKCDTVGFDGNEMKTVWDEKGTREDFEIDIKVPFESLEAYMDSRIVGEF